MDRVRIGWYKSGASACIDTPCVRQVASATDGLALPISCESDACSGVALSARTCEHLLLPPPDFLRVHSGMDLHRRCNLGRGGGLAIRLCRRSGLLSVAQPSHAKNDIFSGVPSVVGKLASWARFSRAGRTMWARRNWTPRNWLGLGWLPSRRARRMKWVRCRSRVAPRTLLPCGCCSMMPSTWIMQYVGKPLTTVVYAQFVD